jgi:hypothetical protein
MGLGVGLNILDANVTPLIRYELLGRRRVSLPRRGLDTSLPAKTPKRSSYRGHPPLVVSTFKR